MSNGVSCPDRVKLAEYGHDQLGPQEAADLERHLGGCRTCLNKVLQGLGRSVLSDIPRCHVVKEIGRGRFGVVYKAWWLIDRPRLVALKVLSRAGNMEEDRFDREIAVLQRIDSVGIVKCLDSGQSGGAKYFIMDFVAGVHLDEYLATLDGHLTAKLELFQRVCRAVAYAHQLGVVHRDLKPGNILIDDQGQPHVLDFGICAIEPGDWSSWARLTITQAGDVIGTLRYMSPEQAWGGMAGEIDQRSDVWSLGIMLYELVTEGDYPYSLRSTPDKPTHEALLDRIRKELPKMPRLGSLPRGRDLEVLVERCLAWEPASRLESAAELADDLERYAAGQRIHTKPLGVAYRVKRLATAAATRSRWMCWAASVASLGIILWLAVVAIDVGWFVTGHQYHTQPYSTGTSFAGDALGDSVVVVGVFEDTIESVLEFAEQRPIGGVTASLPTWRPVHGYLMERLASVGPRVVVWDYYFRTPQAGDAAFVAGLQKLETAGTPVVLAVLRYHQDGTPELSTAITEALGRGLRQGAGIARDMVQRPGEFVTAVKREDGSVLPGLALTTLAAVLHPQARLELDWRGRSKWLSLLYELQPGAYLRERDRIEVTKVFAVQDSESSPAVRPNDLLACNTFPLAGPQEWGRRTIRYQKLLTCPDDQLRALTADKVIVVADLRKARAGFMPDRHRVQFGPPRGIIDDLPGGYLLADAVVGLLDRRYLRSAFPLTPVTFAGMLLVAVAGCLLPIRLAANRVIERPRHRAMVWVTLSSLAALSLAAMVWTRSWTTVHLGMAGLSLFAPMAGSFWVEFARNRHRILDRGRRAIDGVRPATEGTLTLNSQRWRSLPEAG